MDDPYLEVEGSTDTESMTEVTPFTQKSTSNNHWMLHQKAKDEPETDNSDIDNFEHEEVNTTMRKVPSINFRDSTSKTCYKTGNDKKGKKLQRKTTIEAPLRNSEDITDDEDLEITAEEFLRIVQEELNTRGQAKLTLKSHQTSVSLQKTNLAEMPLSKDAKNDDTDCSDVDVSMYDYYAIRHQNQSTIHKKKVKQNIKKLFETDSEEEDIGHSIKKSTSKKDIKEDDSDMSDLEVNIKDYYVIRHETAPKCVSGPFEIDFGMTTLQSSSFKKTPAINVSKYRNTSDDVMTYQEFLNTYQNGKKKECAALPKGDNNTEESEDDSSEDSNPTECDAEDISVEVCKSSKSKQPVIRLIEIEGCQGAIGVICAPTSPIRDDVHGIKFLDHLMDKTEEFSNLTDAEEDAEFLEKGNYAPATDDEELSELEEDSKVVKEYVLPECKKKTCCAVETSLDGKTVCTESSSVKLNESVTLRQFVRETENLSESDVCDWSEEEANIARKMSGDFGKLKLSPLRIAAAANNELNLPVAKGKNHKKGGRARRRGRKKSDGKESKA